MATIYRYRVMLRTAYLRIPRWVKYHMKTSRRMKFNLVQYGIMLFEKDMVGSTVLEIHQQLERSWALPVNLAYFITPIKGTAFKVVDVHYTLQRGDKLDMIRKVGPRP